MFHDHFNFQVHRFSSWKTKGAGNELVHKNTSRTHHKMCVFNRLTWEYHKWNRINSCVLSNKMYFRFVYSHLSIPDPNDHMRWWGLSCCLSTSLLLVICIIFISRRIKYNVILIASPALFFYDCVDSRVVIWSGSVSYTTDIILGHTSRFNETWNGTRVNSAHLLCHQIMIIVAFAKCSWDAFLITPPVWWPHWIKLKYKIRFFHISCN